MKRDAVFQACALVEEVEGNLLDEGDTIHLDVVTLGSELHVLVLLTTHYLADIGLTDTDDSVRDALAGVITLEVVVLMAVDLSDDGDVGEVDIFPNVTILLFTLYAAYLLKNLPQKVKFPADELPGLRMTMASLLHISPVGAAHIEILRSWTMDFEGFAYLTHRMV